MLLCFFFWEFVYLASYLPSSNLACFVADDQNPTVRRESSSCYPAQRRPARWPSWIDSPTANMHETQRIFLPARGEEQNLCIRREAEMGYARDQIRECFEWGGMAGKVIHRPLAAVVDCYNAALQAYC